MLTWLAENSLPIWMLGAIALTMAAIVYFQTRSRGSFLGVVGVIAVTALLLLVNRLIETPREAVERTLYELADVVESNDVQGALRFIAPGKSQIRKDIETLMPQFEIEKANIIGTPQVEIDYSDKIPIARIECRGFVQGKDRRRGIRGGDPAKITIFFIPNADRWLVSEYVLDKNWSPPVGQRRPDR